MNRYRQYYPLIVELIVTIVFGAMCWLFASAGHFFVALAFAPGVGFFAVMTWNEIIWIRNKPRRKRPPFATTDE